MTRRAWGAAAAVPGLILAAVAFRPGSGHVSVHTATRGPFRNEVLAPGRIQTARSTPVTVPADARQPMRIAWLAAPGPIRKGDPVVVFDPTDLEKAYRDARSDQASARTKGRKARAESFRSRAALDLDREVAGEELERAQEMAVSDEELFSRNEILEGRLDRALLSKRVETLQAKGGAAERLGKADVALAGIEDEKATARLLRAQQGLNALKVPAPHDGVLVHSLSWRGDAPAVGDTVYPGQSIAELPDLSSLDAHVFVLEGDAAGLAAGQKARVEVEGQPGLAFEARVARVDALAKSRERRSPVKYFETVLAPEGVPPPALKPGHRVRATILVDDVAEALTVPRAALFERDGRRFVYRLEAGRFETVDVEVGGRSLSRVVIEKGLAPGDRVALHDPEARRAGPSPSPAPPGPAGR